MGKRPATTKRASVMKYSFKVGNCVVEVIVTENENANGKYRPELRGNVFPFADHFHSVRFEVSDHGTAIGFGGNIFKNGMGTKIVEAAVIAQAQVSHFSSLLEELRSCKGEFAAVIEEMKEGNYAMAGIILSMIPDAAEEELLPKAKDSLPEGSKAVSVVTAVMEHPSFKPAFALLDKSNQEVEAMSRNEKHAYRFAKYVRDVFASGLPSGELAQEGAQNGQERATYVTAKMKDFLN